MSLTSILKQKIRKTLFTTPSHSGKFFLSHKFYQWYKSDISEINALNPQKELELAEKKASKIYGTKYTKFLTNGSTSGVIGAILASSQNKKILIGENAHPCHKNGAKLANCEIIEYPLTFCKDWGVYNTISPKEAENLIIKHNPSTLIITSPTYEGFVANIKTIKNICEKYNVTLIVDEAHGALYPFSENLPQSAVKIADYTIQSLHKTAGGLNPTALLHSNQNNPTEALKMITTTSPSYPLLATIERNINFLNSKKGRNEIEKLIQNIKTLEFSHLDDVTKILIKKEGLTGEQISEILYNKYNIEDEKTNDISSLLLCGLGTDYKKLHKLKQALTNLRI